MTGTPDGLTIRRLTLDDPHEEFGRIVLESYLALSGARHDEEHRWDLAQVGQRISSSTVLGAFLGDRPVGCVTFVEGPSDPYAENLVQGESSFRSLGVAPNSQGRGIGRALVEACIAEARNVGSKAVFIYSAQWMEAAHRLYAKLGFVHMTYRDWMVGDPPFRLFGFWKGL